MNGDAKPDTPEFWFTFLMKKFHEDLPENPRLPATENTPRTRNERLNYLWDYYTGNPPLPQVNEAYKDAFRQVVRKSRVSLAEMAVGVMTDRSVISGIWTDADKDADGDDIAMDIARGSNFESMHRDLQTYMFAMGEAYAMVIPPTDEAAESDFFEPFPLITAEDPRYCIGYSDPLAPGKLRAFVKTYYDEVEEQEAAILLWDSKMWKVIRDGEGDSFDPDEWDFDGAPTQFEGIEGLGGVPAVRFANKADMGEFEAHIDLIDRIMDGILQRIIISWYQSFRQRAVRGEIDDTEDFTDDDPNSLQNLIKDPNSNETDIKDLFQADPGALWFVPEGVDFWESQTSDITPIIMAVRDDIKEFAASTRTPMHIISPDAIGESAAGATLMREGLVDKITDRQARQTPSWRLLFQLALVFHGEVERAKTVSVRWAKAERDPLESLGDAATKLQGVLSRQMIATKYLGLTPKEAKINEEQMIAESLGTDQFLGGAQGIASQPGVMGMADDLRGELGEDQGGEEF